jgi:hypothetical protein
MPCLNGTNDRDPRCKIDPNSVILFFVFLSIIMTLILLLICICLKYRHRNRIGSEQYPVHQSDHSIESPEPPPYNWSRESPPPPYISK